MEAVVTQEKGALPKLDPDDQLISAREAARIAGFPHETQVYRAERNAGFPPRIRVGGSTRWLKSEVLNWVAERVAEARSAKASTSARAA
jgi:predicted DNA-binding transcriptional regulator AlpA